MIEPWPSNYQKHVLAYSFIFSGKLDERLEIFYMAVPLGHHLRYKHRVGVKLRGFLDKNLA